MSTRAMTPGAVGAYRVRVMRSVLGCSSPDMAGDGGMCRRVCGLWQADDEKKAQVICRGRTGGINERRKDRSPSPRPAPSRLPIPATAPTSHVLQRLSERSGPVPTKSRAHRPAPPLRQPCTVPVHYALD